MPERDTDGTRAVGIRRLLVANRGEIAVRIMRTAADLGVESVAVAPADDVHSGHTRYAARVDTLAGSGAAAYLDPSAIIAAAVETGCDAIHPGYGFLSESAELAERAEAAGIAFVGPTPATLALFGDKTAARRLARDCGVPLPGGTTENTTVEEATEFMTSLGPDARVMVKAVSGGGGRGMMPVDSPDGLAGAFERCSSEARTAFGSGELYVEERLEGARHIEVQLIGDGRGGVTHLWDRDCSLQRRRQKVVEIAPAELPDDVRRRVLAYATKLAAAVQYRGLGTAEFLVKGEDIKFLEVNPRIQVEHTITEEMLGLDLVELQLRIASGRSLSDLGVDSADIEFPSTTAVQLRLTAERMDHKGAVLPSTGVIEALNLPAGRGVRVDTHLRAGDAVSGRYDSLLAKIVVSHSGGDRRSVMQRALRALNETTIVGVDSNIALLTAVLEDEDFTTAPVDTDYLERNLTTLLERVTRAPRAEPSATGVPASAERRATARVVLTDDQVGVRAPMTGVVVGCVVEEGQAVTAGQPLLIVEAMKMEHVVSSARAGVVDSLPCAVGTPVDADDLLIVLKVDEEPADSGSVSEEQVPDRPRRDIEDWKARVQSTLDAGRADAVKRRHATGRRTARENIADLLDPDSFTEFGGLVLAAQQKRMSYEDLVKRTPADGLVCGIGQVRGRSTVVMSYDYTVMAGTQGYFNHAKMRRMFRTASEHSLPVVMFVEGGGGRPGDTDMTGIAQLDEQTFTMAARLSGQVPVVSIVAGRTFAGNAALASLSDLIIATEDSNLGMGGPAMIEGGGLGKFTPEDIGPAAVQSGNGVVDVLVEDEREAVDVAKRYLTLVSGLRSDEFEEHDQNNLRSAVPENRKRSYDVGSVIETIADVGSCLELRPGYGRGIVTVLARIEGRAIGVVANNPRHLGGAIDADAAEKAARFIRLCDIHDVPILSLVDTPGFMVGPDAEETATVRRFGRLFLAGAHARVPLVAVVLRKGYGLGAMAMTGGDFTVPLATLSWPSGEFGGMGLEGYVRLGYRVELASIPDPEAAQRRFDELVAGLYERGKAISVAAVDEIDDVIDPVDTRRVVTALFDAASPGPRASATYLDSW